MKTVELDDQIVDGLEALQVAILRRRTHAEALAFLAAVTNPVKREALYLS